VFLARSKGMPCLILLTMPIDVAAISIIDRLTKLLTIRERNRERVFNNFIQPIYQDAEAVARDYMGLFAELIQRLETAATAKELIIWLEQRRAAYQPVRMKIRALLNDEAFQTLSQSKSTAARTRFARGLWGVLKGSFLLAQNADDGRYAYLREYGYSDHPILLLLESLRKSSHSTATLDDQRGFLLWLARKQQLAIERAWTDVVTAYAELKRRLL